jgi:hypothetical protein
MVIPPDKYSIKKKFLKGLLIDMIDHLLKTKWVTAEHTPFEIILEEVKVMECSTQSCNLYKKEQQSHPITIQNNLVIIIILILPLGHAEW